MNRLLLVLLAGCVGLSACSKKEEVAAAVAPPSAGIPAATPNSGKIVQIQQAGAYTYAEVETASGKVWIAGGPLNAKQGDVVQWGDAAVMKNFHSKTLNRDFDEILFVSSWAPQGAVPTQIAPHGSMAGAMPPAMSGHPPIGSTAPVAGQPAAGGNDQGSVKSVAAAAGYTYAEVDQGGSVIWIAAPQITLKAGDKVRWTQGSLMQNFTSKSLGRTFDRIIFAGQLEVLQ